MTADIVERLREARHNDHDRGCEGRMYTCTCGYDNRIFAAAGEAADDIEKLRRERDEARGWAKDWHNIVDLTCTVIGLGVLDAPEVVEAVRDKFDQAERRATAAEAKVTEMREALHEAREIVDACVHQEVPTLGWANEVLAAIDRALAAREGAE